MKAPTPEAINAALEFFSNVPDNPGTYVGQHILTLKTALKAEQERLDWLLSNLVHITDGEYWNGVKNRWLEINDRSDIDSLRSKS